MQEEAYVRQQAAYYGCKSVEEYYELIRKNEEKALFKRKNKSWFKSGTRKGFLNEYNYERKRNKRYNSIPNTKYHSNEWIDFNFLVNRNWESIGLYKHNITYLSKAISFYYILENKLYEQDLDKKQVKFHIDKIREEVSEILDKVISYQEAEKTLKAEKDNIDNEINIAKQQLETLELQKQIIDNQSILTKEQLKINDQIQSSNLNYINVFENNKEKEKRR